MGDPWGQRTQVMGVINLTPDSFSDGAPSLKESGVRLITPITWVR